MQGIEPPDLHFLNAAQGWLGLDCPEEARIELNAIAPELHSHPAVLAVHWTLCVREQRWEEARDIAQLEIRFQPEDASGWLHHAYAVRRASNGGLIMAWGALLPAAEKFPAEPVIAFNLSCYACQLKQLETSRIWLKRALTIGNRAAVKKMALADEDLKPLWPEIAGL
ncbi:MAG: tetratricopeptide repeat protein [Verrucomicrobiae bacterium]|nr:tetratricopeptide repeat protein [Verrucomicrobiae bacterium]